MSTSFLKCRWFFIKYFLSLVSSLRSITLVANCCLPLEYPPIVARFLRLGGISLILVTSPSNSTQVLSIHRPPDITVRCDLTLTLCGDHLVDSTTQMPNGKYTPLISLAALTSMSPPSSCVYELIGCSIGSFEPNTPHTALHNSSILRFHFVHMVSITLGCRNG